MKPKRDDQGRIAPGIYIGLDAETYHDDEALGGSDLQNLLASPLTYQAASAMNPHRIKKTSTAMTLGSAEHCALLEGPDVFKDRFYPDLKEEFFGAATSIAGVEFLCGSIGIKVPDICYQTAETTKGFKAPTVQWRRQMWAAYKSQTENRIKLTRPQWSNALAFHRVLAGSEFAWLFRTPGFSEVSIFWEDPVWGHRCKARLDRLCPGFQLQWKTFAPRHGQAVEAAAIMAFERDRVPVTCVHYIMAVQAAKRMKLGHVQDLRPMDDGSERLIHQAGKDVLEFFGDFINAQAQVQYLIAYHSKAAHDLIVREFRLPLHKGAGKATPEYAKAALADREWAMRLYTRCMKAHGRDGIWWDGTDIVKPFDDDDFRELGR